MSWRNLFLENFGQKLFALGLAVLIWLTVSSSEGVGLLPADADHGRAFAEVPIVVLTSAADLRRFEVTPSKVRVELRGPPQLLKSLSPGSIEAYVNLVQLEKTPQTVEIHVNGPHGVHIADVHPPQVLVDRLKNPISTPKTP